MITSISRQAPPARRRPHAASNSYLADIGFILYCFQGEKYGFNGTRVPELGALSFDGLCYDNTLATPSDRQLGCVAISIVWPSCGDRATCLLTVEPDNLPHFGYLVGTLPLTRNLRLTFAGGLRWRPDRKWHQIGQQRFL